MARWSVLSIRVCVAAVGLFAIWETMPMVYSVMCARAEYDAETMASYVPIETLGQLRDR